MTAVVLVTGGASGIGAAVARRFARGGANVVIADIDETTGSALATDIGGLFVPTDVTREHDNRAAVDAALATYGGLDVVHLNAGTGGGGALGADFDVERHRRGVAVNVDGTVFGFLAALPTLAATGGGAIVATSSIAGIAPAPFDPSYAAGKHAIIGLVRSLAPGWVEAGITINAVCPGFVATPMLGDAQQQLSESGVAIADPDEIAAAVQSIASGGQTGQVWSLQAHRPPELVQFPAIGLSLAGS